MTYRSPPNKRFNVVASLNQNLPSVVYSGEGTRSQRMAQELSFALSKAEPRMIARWGVVSGKHFTVAVARRTKNLLGLADRLITGAGREGRHAIGAYKNGELGSHAKRRMDAAYKSAADVTRQISTLATSVAAAVSTNPKAAAPQLLALVLSSVLVSGGPDGDGGAADLDLMFGIDAHRSIFSHSILMGAALEAGILSLVELVQMLYDKLPAQRDPLWDALHLKVEEFSRSAQVGASLGLAYHLFVDGLAQPAPYTDLPVPLPMEAHQSIFVGNAAAEAMDAGNKTGTSSFFKGRELEERRHKHFSAQRTTVPEGVEEWLSESERALINRYGAWLQALSDGDIQPLTPSQEQFVLSVRGHREPSTQFEEVWHLYSMVLEILRGSDLKREASTG